MARREHRLTSTITIDPYGEFDLIRIHSLVIELDPGQEAIRAHWECCRDDGAGNIIWAGKLHSGVKEYLGADFDTFHKTTSAGAGEKLMAEIEDQIFADIVTDRDIGAGIQQDYSF